MIEVAFAERGAAQVRFIEADGAGGSDPGKVIVDEKVDGAAVLRREVGDVDLVLNHIREKAAEEGFWSLAPTVEVLDGTISGDGSTWIIEGRRDGVCKTVIRKNQRDPAFTAFAEQLIRLSGKRFFHDEYY